ncbi:hypothetical protein Tco_0557984 [Tanacetum coccineum]
MKGVSRAGDEDCTQKALVEYQAEYGVYVEAGGEEEEEVQEVQRPIDWDKAKKKATTSSASSTSGNEEALATLMISEYAILNEPYLTTKIKDCAAFLEIRKKELELKQQKLAMRKYEQRQKDEMFYMHPTNHLTGVHLERMMEMKRTIKRKRNLPYLFTFFISYV